jgi:uncharacterized cysteine cluster protein YcgN (CxxCxxCC family)
VAAKPWFDRLPLTALDTAQWEALCDGCGRCCLHRLEDEETGGVFSTRVHCRYLDPESCRCRDYANRARNVPDCTHLDPAGAAAFHWLPPTCAYRLRALGRPLPAWHPLRSGDPATVHAAGVSVRGRVLSEDYVAPEGLEEHIVTWVEEDPTGADRG